MEADEPTQRLLHMDWSMVASPSVVPVYFLLLVPLISLKDMTLFSKLNALGTANIFILVGVILKYAFEWGVHVDRIDVSSPEYIPLALPSFYCLTGVLSMGLFIHNAVLTIVKGNKVQENNVSVPMMIPSFIWICQCQFFSSILSYNPHNFFLHNYSASEISLPLFSNFTRYLLTV